MKRRIHSSHSSSSSISSNSQHTTESEPIPKRPRMFISSPTPPPDDDDDDDEDNAMDDNEEDIVIDEPFIQSVTTTENSQHEYISDDDDDIIEIERETSDLSADETDNAVIIVSDSDSDDNSDDQGIDVTDDTPSFMTSIIDASISSPDTTDIEIIQDTIDDELSLIDDLEEEQDEDDQESLAIVNNENELIDLTDDEPTSLSCSSNLNKRKLSTDVQQCPICLETLSHLQRTGVYLIITRCRHVMCTLCSGQLLATSSRCPLCRENVTSTTLMPYCILT